MISRQVIYTSDDCFFHLLSSVFIHRTDLFQHLRFGCIDCPSTAMQTQAHHTFCYCTCFKKTISDSRVFSQFSSDFILVSCFETSHGLFYFCLFLVPGLSLSPKTSSILTSACHRESGVAGLPYGSMLQCFGSGHILLFPTWCTSLLTCCPLSQLEIQNGTSNILFWCPLQHKFIPGHITSPAKATPLAFVNVLKESQRMLFLSSLSELCPSAAHSCIFLL